MLPVLAEVTAGEKSMESIGTQGFEALAIPRQSVEPSHLSLPNHEASSGPDDGSSESLNARRLRDWLQQLGHQTKARWQQAR